MAHTKIKIDLCTMQKFDKRLPFSTFLRRRYLWERDPVVLVDIGGCETHASLMMFCVRAESMFQEADRSSSGLEKIII